MKILVFGGSGLVGSQFIKSAGQVFEIKSPLATEADILNKDQVRELTQEFNPDTVVNFAAYTNVEGAESQRGDKSGICYLVNAVGAKVVAEICYEFDKKLIHISTEYVFDGQKKESPYVEEDKPNPINWYGQTKYFGEQFVLQSGCFATVVRICMPFSAFYELKKDIARFFLEKLKSGSETVAVEDQKITPTSVSDIAYALQAVVNKGVQGIYHVCSTSSTTPYEFAKLIAQNFDLDASLIKPISFNEYNKRKQAKLLKNSWLDCTKFVDEFGEKILHTVEEGVGIFKKAVDERSLN